MTSNKALVVTATLVACITSVSAQNLPYNPTFLIQGQNSKVYQFSPNAAPQFSVYDVKNALKSDDTPEAITSQLPFLSNTSNSFVPIATRNGLTVFSGECSEGDQELELWTFGYGTDNATWTQMKTTSSDPGLSAKYLAAGFAFPSSTSSNVDSLYIFGGMCPNGASGGSAWLADASYSNTMLTISPEQGNDYEVSLTGTRSPPIAEAGLSITPLIPTSVRADNSSQQQSFVLLGGHTQQAFINMSQVAMFSMPEQAWAFIGINQPSDTVVEPRSGHTAVMTEDGSRIVVFGGWVGDITNSAQPSLAILEIGQGFGGNGSWAWTVPKVANEYLGSANGLYGHAALMLPGDIMMVTGGYPITSSGKLRSKRDNAKPMFYNLTSSTWSNSYINPITVANNDAAHPTLNRTQKTGLGTGLGIGLAIAIVIAVLGVLYYRRKRAQRIIREKHLREMALGTNNVSTVEIPRRGSGGILSSFRSASWGARQEQQIQGDGGNAYNTKSIHLVNDSPPNDLAESDTYWNGAGDVPGPNIIQRNSLRSRPPPGFGNHLQPPAPAVFTIEEVEERSERGSIKRPRTAESRPLSDPFKDPPQALSKQQMQQIDEAALQRRQEVQMWVEDWQSAAENMNVSRSPSKANSYARTYSNLSAYNSSSSGDKSSSDRTNSNLSERSIVSNLSAHRPQANGTVSRTISQRSGSAGYALFATAASAMGKITGRQDNVGIERSASKRAVSTGDLAQLAARKRSNSVEQNNMPRLTTPRSREDLNMAGEYFTPPESPIKDYKGHNRRRSNSSTSYSHSNSLTSQSKKALGALSQSARRILSGTNNVNVLDRVSNIEGRSRDNSPTKDTYFRSGLDSSDNSPRKISSTGAEFWKHRQGARDWEDENKLGEGSGTVRRRSGRPVRLGEDGERNDEGEDWDVEAAVQQRVVQVMFTVPKEKLRVVNADNLSLLSRSDTHASRDSNRSLDDSKDKEKEINRMSRVTEGAESDYYEEEDTTIVGSASNHDSTVANEKGKDAVFVNKLRTQKSGSTIGKAL